MTEQLIPTDQDFDALLRQVRQCRHCEPDLPLSANPVVQLHPDAQLMVIGQAPGTRVHATGVPWNDPSGDRLRRWLDMDRDSFYDPHRVAIMPMGFCYPGKGKTGDLPPRKECAPLWHERLLTHLPNIKLTLLIGQYAQQRYLSNDYKTLTARVQNWRASTPLLLPMPHPSPRNRYWFQRHPWFEEEVVPWLQQQTRLLFPPSD